ncbi:MAG: hypothetical protein JXN64_15955 [Spirochaetes bacterium]|nr:hypothetical protein [Spirochaetota bacterium]
MKAIFVEKNQINENEVLETNFKEEFLTLMSEYRILESHIVYFSAGDSKIKEILVKKEPSYSV